jgi:hypothetical protein
MLIFGTWLIMVLVGFWLGSLTHSWIGCALPFGVWASFWGYRALLEWREINRRE